MNPTPVHYHYTNFCVICIIVLLFQEKIRLSSKGLDKESKDDLQESSTPHRHRNRSGGERRSRHRKEAPAGLSVDQGRTCICVEIVMVIAFMCACVRACLHTCACICACMYVCAHVCMRMDVVCMYVCVHVYMYVCTSCVFCRSTNTMFIVLLVFSISVDLSPRAPYCV